MQPLDLMQLPLQGTALIEASAGTGKTYTIAALYLRLVLGHGVPAPLRPDQILVVTFTDAATSELKSRIQARLVQAAQAFSSGAAPDATLSALLQAYPPADWPALAERLLLAAQWMDEAAISTIHGFCQRMLTEHAFAAGSQFECELSADQSALLLQVAMDYWRSQVYPLALADFVSYQARFTEPAQLLAALKPLWRRDVSLAVPPAQGIAELLQTERTQRAQALAALKQPWLQWLDELAALIEQGRANGQTNNTKLRADYVAGWLAALAQWRDDPSAVAPKAGKWQERLTPEGLADAWKGPAPQHPALDAIAALPQALAALPDCSFALRLHALNWLQRQFRARQQQFSVQGFDDLLSNLADALTGPQGEMLADLIRVQYPQALIDEFQDTDQAQWQIFAAIYQPAQQRQDCGLLLIGDPKQAIYSFRGADIYTYLQAKQQTAGRHYSLATNYRSATAMVSAVNQLFSHAETRPDGDGAFLFRRQPGLLTFESVAACGRAEQLVIGGQPAVACHWQLLDFRESADKPPVKAPAKGAYLQQAAEQAARHIALLLAGARDGQCGFQRAAQATAATPPLRPLQTGDIAVLVNNQQEADLIRRALADYQVASVYLSDKGSVYQSPLAAELFLWLRACANPRDVSSLRSALASPALDLSYQQLLALSDDEWQLEARQQQFAGYLQLWRERGILAMLHLLMQDFALVSKLSRYPDAERRLTDLLHLAELLQQASRDLEGEAALLRFLQNQLAQPDQDELDAVRLRLESDESLVRIVTIHKSKGLEYPLVYLPFLCAARELDPAQLPYVWHDQQGRLHLASQFDETSFATACQERLGEDLRKLYVALTRAQHYCWIALAPQAERSALAYLLDSSGNLPADVASVLQTFARAPEFALVDTPLADAPLYQPPVAGPTSASGFRYDGARSRERWQISSYSGLLHGIDDSAWSAPLQNRLAEPVLDIPPGSAEPPAADLPEMPADPLAAAGGFATAFRRGAVIGTFLHEQLEWAAAIGFAQVQHSDLFVAQLSQSMQRHGLLLQLSDGCWQRQLLESELTEPGRFSDEQAAVSDLQRWLLQLLQTPLPQLGSLSQLQHYRAELEFMLPANHLDIALLDALVSQAYQPSAARPALNIRQLNGMLKGFIDLSFSWDGRYYVLDFKSNAQPAQQYDAAQLWPMMLEHRYDLQAALYLLALHRLLRQRLADYQPARHLGGAVYWFLRGSACAGAGCLLLPVAPDWLAALDALFGGDPTPARHWLAAADVAMHAAVQ